MHWRVKSALRHAMLALPGGPRLYRWLTYQVMGTMSGMAAKWYRVFPMRIALLQEEFGDRARGQAMWCFDSGTTIAAGLCMAVATDEPGLLTDRWDRLSDRYLGISTRLLKDRGPDLERLSHAPAGRLEQVLQQTVGKTARAALAELGKSYAGFHAAADAGEWRERFGCIFSGGTLEHYTAEQLEAEVARMCRVLKPGGFMSHTVDHRDHRWHADKRLSPLAHLTMPEDEFLSRFGNPLEHHNRWLRSRYVELLTRHGLTVQCRDLINYTDEFVPLDASRLAAPFREASEEDLHSLVTHFVAVRR